MCGQICPSVHQEGYNLHKRETFNRTHTASASLAFIKAGQRPTGPQTDTYVRIAFHAYIHALIARIALHASHHTHRITPTQRSPTLREASQKPRESRAKASREPGVVVSGWGLPGVIKIGVLAHPGVHRNTCGDPRIDGTGGAKLGNRAGHQRGFLRLEGHAGAFLAEKEHAISWDISGFEWD